MSLYRVWAHNSHTESENKIHSDDVARDYGFRGGLVPGVTVYAYMTRPVVEHFGMDWLSRGTMTVRFRKPFYEGEEVAVDFDGRDLVARNPEGEECAVGTAGLESPELEDLDFPSAPLPATGRPPASPEVFASIPVLGSLEAGFHSDRAGDYLDEVDNDLAIYRDKAVAHPGWLLGFANAILGSNVKLGPWIHVASTVTNLRPVADGDRLSVRGRVARTYEKADHRFVDLDVLMLANGHPATRVAHTAIYEPRTLL